MCFCACGEKMDVLRITCVVFSLMYFSGKKEVACLNKPEVLKESLLRNYSNWVNGNSLVNEVNIVTQVTSTQ